VNILFLSESFYPHYGGAELATYLYAGLLSRADFNVRVVTNRFAGESDVSKEGKLTVYRLPLLKRGGSIKYSILQRFDVLFSSFMRKMLRWADVVYVPRFWYSAIPLAKAYGKPVITHLHDYIAICPLANYYNSSKDTICDYKTQLCSLKCIYVYERNQGRGFAETLTSVMLNSTFGHYLSRFVALSDAIICVSKTQKNLITTRTPSLSRKIHVVYNPLPELPQIDIEGDDFGYFGGPSPPKGFHVLCHAMTKINVEKLTVHATKFSNPTKDMCELANKLRISLHGKLDDESYERLYKQIRAVIVSSVWPEPLPYVVAEAILRGRLVIASRIGGIPELVEGCKGAFLFEAGNYYELAEKLEYVKGLGKEVAADLGTHSREVLTKKFSNERTIRDFTSVCDALT